MKPTELIEKITVGVPCVVGGDPEYDEPGSMKESFLQANDLQHFIMFQSAVRNNEGVTRFEEVSDTYTPAPNDPLLEEALMEVLPAFVEYVQTFGLKAPVIVLANLRDKGDVARFVDGTESDNPVFLLDPEPTLNLTGYRLREFVVQSLKHELGHAYLRTLGVEYEEDEEGVVEEFALTGERHLLEAWAYDVASTSGYRAIVEELCEGVGLGETVGQGPPNRHYIETAQPRTPRQQHRNQYRGE